MSADSNSKLVDIAADMLDAAYQYYHHLNDNNSPSATFKETQLPGFRFSNDDVRRQSDVYFDTFGEAQKTALRTWTVIDVETEAQIMKNTNGKGDEALEEKLLTKRYTALLNDTEWKREIYKAYDASTQLRRILADDRLTGPRPAVMQHIALLDEFRKNAEVVLGIVKGKTTGVG